MLIIFLPSMPAPLSENRNRGVSRARGVASSACGRSLANARKGCRQRMEKPSASSAWYTRLRSALAGETEVGSRHPPTLRLVSCCADGSHARCDSFYHGSIHTEAPARALLCQNGHAKALISLQGSVAPALPHRAFVCTSVEEILEAMPNVGDVTVTRTGVAGGSRIEANEELDVRVGRIVEAWEHPDSDKLWCERIDVGEDEPREIASGLRAYYPEAEMLVDRRVLVVCNLKAAKLAGFASSGMVLCASSEGGETVAFVEPPDGAAVFTRGMGGSTLWDSERGFGSREYTAPGRLLGAYGSQLLFR